MYTCSTFLTTIFLFIFRFYNTILWIHFFFLTITKLHVDVTIPRG